MVVVNVTKSCQETSLPARNLTAKAAEEHISLACPVMAQLVLTHGPCAILQRTPPPFQILAGSIISQMLSAQAATSIKNRVTAIVGSFTPEGFLDVSSNKLRDAGLSARKICCIVELARQVKDGRLSFDTLDHLSDEEIIVILTKLPGIGRWTAEMFLIFGLSRLNVLALGDAGLQRATKLLYGADADLGQVGHSWRPYRSIASWYLWRHLDAPKVVNPTRTPNP
jgi:DNA-3-methyladenine glycosylase II